MKTKIKLIASMILVASHKPVAAGFFASKLATLRSAWTYIAKNKSFTARRDLKTQQTFLGTAGLCVLGLWPFNKGNQTEKSDLWQRFTLTGPKKGVKASEKASGQSPLFVMILTKGEKPSKWGSNDNSQAKQLLSTEPHISNIRIEEEASKNDYSTLHMDVNLSKCQVFVTPLDKSHVGMSVECHKNSPLALYATATAKEISTADNALHHNHFTGESTKKLHKFGATTPWYRRSAWEKRNKDLKDLTSNSDMILKSLKLEEDFIPEQI